MANILHLDIHVEHSLVEEVTDAINETLNELASNGVIDDTDDDAWRWTMSIPGLTT